MSAHPTQAATPDDPGQSATGTHRHSQALDDLVTMGTSLARLLHAQAIRQAEAADAAVPPHPIPGAPHEPPATALITLTTAFDRIARAVRRCVALARKLDEPVRATPDPAHRRTAARREVIRAVEDTIHRTAHEGDRAETLHAELRDRLDDPDLEDDLAHRPIADIIAEIRRDLGLASPPGDHPWRRRTPADIRDLNARAAAPSRAPQPGTEMSRSQAWPCAPSPQSDQPGTTPQTQPGLTQTGYPPPADPAETIASILRGPAHTQGRWRPPPSG